MTKLIRFGMAVFAVMALALAGTGSAAAASPYSSAEGGSKIIAGESGSLIQVAFSAHNGPNGLSGHVVLHSATFGDAQGHVTCLTVTGNQFAANFTIDKGLISGYFGPGQTLLLVGQDNSKSAGLPDTLSLYAPTVGCPLVPSISPVVQGNVRVYDATVQ